jgi:hypothetical protein
MFDMIPEDPGFKGQVPDDEGFEGYTGNLSLYARPRGVPNLTVV